MPAGQLRLIEGVGVAGAGPHAQAEQVDQMSYPDPAARFASYLADLAAHLDDPAWDQECRASVHHDPQTQRVVFFLVAAVTANPWTPSLMTLLGTAATLRPCAASRVVRIVGLLG